MSNRVAKWDNVKCILIILVIIGHFSDPFTEKSDICKILFFFIYLFHMPAFFFVSGMLSQNTLNQNRLSPRKVVPYFILALFIGFMRFVPSFNDGEVFKVFRINSASWFLLVLGYFILITHFVRNVDWKYVLTISIIISMVLGYDDTVGSLFGVMRSANMFPFYYLGYLSDRERLQTIGNKPLAKFIGSTVLVGIFLIIIAAYPGIYDWRRFITGANSYYDLPFDIPVYIGLLRIPYMIVTLALILAIIFIAPSKEIPVFTHIGRCTLSIYIWHHIIQYFLIRTSWFKEVVAMGPWQTVFLFIGLSVAIAAFLSIEVFNMPLDWILNPKKKD